MFLLIIIIVAIVFVLVSSYNTLQHLGQRVKSSNAKIKGALQKKIELTNKLMDIAKSYGDHEKFVYLKMSNDFTSAYKDADAAFTKLKALSIQYPELKANEAYMDLSDKITKIEEDILSRRDMYNDAVEHYNAKRASVPCNFFASSLGFQEAPYFDTNSDVDIDDFKTDDGEMLKDLLKTGSQKAQDFTKKGVEKFNEKKDELKDRFEKAKEDKTEDNK